MSDLTNAGKGALPGPTRVFLVALIGAGAVIITASIYTAAQQSLMTGPLVLMAVGLVTGCLTVKVPGIETRFSLSDALILTAILLFGPEWGAIVAAVDALAASRFTRGDPQCAWRVLFNVGAAVLAVWLSGHVFVLLGGTPGSLETVRVWTFVLAVVGMTACYSIFGTGAVSVVLALTQRSAVTTVWRENFAWLWIAHAWSALAAAAIAAYAPRVSLLLLAIMGAVAAVGYATVRVYLRKVEESTSHLQKLNDLYLATIKALAMAIDAKDQVTHGHIRRVQIYTVGLARALGITDELTLKGIEAGALLHDTGKIAVPEHILNKPGKLNVKEYERMKTHAAIGAEILSGIEFPFPVIPYVRHHHENWDGNGYPDGLKGEEIPLGARILSVVDCFDALTSDRPYRRALSAEDAIAILRERSGNMYDARVVEKFVEVLPSLASSVATDEHLAATSSIERGAPEHAHATPDEVSGESWTPELDDIPTLALAGLLPDEAAFAVTSRLKRRVRFAACAVYVPRPQDDVLEALHVSGRHADLFRHSAIRVGCGLSGWVAACGQRIINADPTLDVHGPAALSEVRLASALVVPLTMEAGARGALALYATPPNAFTLEDADVVGVAADLLARALRAGGTRRTTLKQVKHCA